MKSFAWRRWTILALAGPVLACLGGLAGSAPGLVEKVYARGIYPWLARPLAGLQAWFPWSFTEILLYGALLGLPVWALLGYRSGRAVGLGFWLLAGRGGLRLAGILGLLIVTGMVLWGFNYRREAFATQVGWTLAPSSVGELEALATDLRVELVRLDGLVPRDPDGTLRLEEPWKLLRTAGVGYERLPANWAVHHSPWAKPKRLLWPGLLSRTLTYGVFAPWTGEPHVNGSAPSCVQPFTACHELAHQKGFGREDEANFLGYAAALQHPDARFPYSATLAAFQEAVGRLPAERRGALLKDLPVGIIADWRAERAWVRRHRNPVSEASQKVYAGYLKTQGMADGLQSYGRFLDLMLAQRRSR